MKPENSLNHSKWECKYHIVWIPKYRKKTNFVSPPAELGVYLLEIKVILSLNPKLRIAGMG
jgi:putative transposase